jgi:hypothetical protein
MARGLDELEGDAIELGLLILLGLLAILVFTTWEAPRVWTDGKVLSVKSGIDTLALKIDSFLLDPFGLHSLSGDTPDEAHAGVSSDSSSSSPAESGGELSMYDLQELT